MKYVLVNPEEVEDLPPGRHRTRVVDAYWSKEGDMVIEVEYVPGDPRRCLLPLVIEEHDDVAVDSAACIPFSTTKTEGR